MREHYPSFTAAPPKDNVSASTAAGIAVSCHGVTKRFGTDAAEVVALRGVDLEVKEGELMMLVGPSGCGKTTLISIVAGILTANEGDCSVLSKSFAKMSGRERLDFRARNIGFIFQSFNLLPSLTLAENVAVPLIINGVERHEAISRAGELLKDVGLGTRIDNKPNQLSGGQQQRVAIARALVHRPKLLVCDEPTSALDHETGAKIMQLIRDMKMQFGTTVIIVTHDSRIFEFADRIAYMDDGKVERVEALADVKHRVL
ncbi:MAG: ABC transporter ATP-binding protein [Proteobacteria bacterium]|nr:ABC transporter ATP-binding protein [Pseudomonadota bacterium]